MRVCGPRVPGIHKAPPAAVAVTIAVVYLQEAVLLSNTNVFTLTSEVQRPRLLRRDLL